MRHKLVCILPYIVVPRSHIVWKRKTPVMYTEGRLWGSNRQTPRWIFILFFNCVCTKILSELCSCIYEIQKFCAWKRKKMYSIFTFCFSLLALPLDPVWGLLLSRRPSSTHFRQFLIYLLWNPSTVKSWVRLWCNHPNLYPLKALGCGSPDTGIMWGHLMLDIARHVIRKKIMSWISHKNCISTIKIAV